MRIPSAVAALALLPSLVLAQGRTVTVGSASAAPGTTARGAIDVPAGVDSATSIAVAVINGARPGKTLAVISGAHGTEYASIVAAQRLIDRIDPARLAGTVIIAPLLNRASFERMRVHTNPVDEKGMNASYPGDPDGTQSVRALALVARQIVQPADVILDLHGGDIDEDLRPYSYWFRTGNTAQDSAGRSLALAFGLDHIIVRDLDMSNPANARSVSGYGLSLGKTVLVSEAGRSGTVMPADVTALVDGSLNVLSALGMLARPVPRLTRVTWLGEGQRVRADSAGMFFATVARDARVTKGQKLGYTTDFLGKPTGDLVAPIDGLVTFIRGVPSTWRGATVVNIGNLLSDPGAYKKP